MLQVAITPQFRRMFRKLDRDLQTEALEKIELFKDPQQHKALKVHKLKGELKNNHSFSVNYKTRIVFVFEKRKRDAVILTAIGNHDIYK